MASKNSNIADMMKSGEKAMRSTANSADSALSKQDDLGAKIASGSIKAGVGTYSVFKVAQTASTLVTKAPTLIVNTTKATIDITTTAYRASVTVGNTVGFLRSGSTVAASNMLYNQAVATGLNQTATSKAIISGVDKMHRGITGIQTGAVSVGSALKTGASTTYHVVRGITNGSLRTSVVAGHALMMARNVSLKGLEVAGNATVKGILQGGRWTLLKGIPGVAKLGSGLSLGAANMLTKSDDMALQGVGGALKLGNYGLRTTIGAGRLTGRALKTGAKGILKTGNAAWKTASFIKNKGLRAAWNRARRQIGKAMVQAGNSVMSLIMNLVKMMGKKILLPILLLVCGVLIIQSVLSAPLQAIGSIFGGSFSSSSIDADGNIVETEHEITDYLNDSIDGIPALRSSYINDLHTFLISQLKANGGDYHYVMFYTNRTQDVIDNAANSIDGVFPSKDELLNVIQPIYNAVLLKDYELTPTDEQAKQALHDIFNKLFVRTESKQTVYCDNQHSCGSVHAKDDCPNMSTGSHSAYTCETCCNATCSGYKYCNGHEVLSVTLNIDGTYSLLNEYFIKPIDDLSNLATRTQEEEDKLNELIDYYEICQEYINQVNSTTINFSNNGTSLKGLDSIQWVTGTRVGNRAVVDLALTQVGQVGGQPYWSYYGFSSRVAWCACFTHYCYNVSGYGYDYGKSANNAYCPTLINYFKQRGCWQNRDYRDLAIGDVIFFDWEGDGESDHVGLVVGRDDTKVYTVEGNSGDAVKIRSYNLNSSVIYGYAAFNN